MQSAARVPILVSFEVEDYPGPDNDPILKEGIERAADGVFNDHTKHNQSSGILAKRSNSLSVVSRKITKRLNAKKKSELMRNESIVMDE